MANASIPVGKQLENDIVITEYLRLLKDYIINNEEKINYTNIKDVKWVLTVPPLWDDNSKNKMKELAMKADMSNVEIALEPEVDSLAIFYDKNIKKEILKQGTSFLMVDMGGYTVDFTAMKILDENKNLEQLLQPVSFAFGSNLINEKIIEIIEKAYSKEKLEKVKKTNYKLWEKTLDEIEEKKKQINNNEAKNFRININFNEGKSMVGSIFAHLIIMVLIFLIQVNISIFLLI
jgi:molecular chaperone DnaK (HSP70)